MRIKIDKADRVFALYIKERDLWQCQRCKRIYDPYESGSRVSLQNSHYFGRGKEGTRFDEENCDSLCFGCHREWGSNDREAYREFKIKQMGEKKFKAMHLRASTYFKKDRKLAHLAWNEAYRLLCRKHGVTPLKL